MVSTVTTVHLVPIYSGVDSNNHAARGVYYSNTNNNPRLQTNNTKKTTQTHDHCCSCSAISKQAIKPPPSPSPSLSPSLSQNPQLLVAGARLETPTEELMQSPWPGGWNCCSCAWLNSDVRKARSTLNIHACVNGCLLSLLT